MRGPICIACVAPLVCAVSFAQAPAATPYPVRPVRIVAPQPPGSGFDTYTRAIAQKLSETWGQQVIVDNRPGANGIIGVEQVTKAKPDGSTILAAFTSLLVHFQQQRWRSAGRRDAKQIEPRKNDGAVGTPRGARNAAYRVADLHGCATAHGDFAQRASRRVPEAHRGHRGWPA